MMDNLQIFNNAEFGSVRALVINNEPWFVGKDVAAALGYGKGKSLNNAVTTHVDDEDKGVTEMMTPGGKQNLIIINESGIYSLILSSKLPSARKFKRWVTTEVLPTIRKYGMYATDELISNPDLLIAVATQLKEEKTKNTELQQKIEADKPKTIFADAVATSTTSILVGDLAKLICQNGYTIGQKRLFEWLRNNGYLIKSGCSYNIPKRQYLEQGLFEVKESTWQNPDGSIRINKTTKVTGKGQIYFVNKFLALQGGDE